MFENPYSFILLGWLAQVWAAEQLLSWWTAFNKTKIKLSAACPQDKLQVCSLMVLRYSNAGIYLKHQNQNAHSIMPHLIWTQDLGFIAKIHQLPNVQSCRCNPDWKVFFLNPRHSSSIQDTALFVWALPAKSLHLAHQYVQLEVSGSSFLWLCG